MFITKQQEFLTKLITETMHTVKDLKHAADNAVMLTVVSRTNSTTAWEAWDKPQLASCGYDTYQYITFYADIDALLRMDSDLQVVMKDSKYAKYPRLAITKAMELIFSDLTIGRRYMVSEERYIARGIILNGAETAELSHVRMAELEIFFYQSFLDVVSRLYDTQRYVRWTREAARQLKAFQQEVDNNED